MFKLAVVACALALFQSTSAQCIGAYNGLDVAAGYGCAGAVGPSVGLCDAWNLPFGNGLGPAALAASNGAGLVVSSASPIAPTGVSMTSENCYEGPLAVTGAIPFLGAVALDGVLPTIGGGAVTYGCGNGNVAILSEDIDGPYGFGLNAYDGLVGPYGYDGLGYGFAGPYGCDGLGYGFAGPYGLDGLGYGYGRGAYGYNGCAGPFY